MASSMPLLPNPPVLSIAALAMPAAKPATEGDAAAAMPAAAVAESGRGRIVQSIHCGCPVTVWGITLILTCTIAMPLFSLHVLVMLLLMAAELE